MAKHSGATFKGQRLVIDGESYEGCTFENCTLVYRGAALPAFNRCTFNPPRFTFEDEADNTLSFLKSLAADPGMRHVIRDTFPELGRP